MTDAFRDGATTIAQFVPKLVLFLLILVVGQGHRQGTQLAPGAVRL